MLENSAGIWLVIIMIKGRRYIMAFLMLALLLNAVLPMYSFVSARSNDKQYSELSKLLGDKVVICAGNLPNKLYVTSFERLSQEQHQKLKKQVDTASSFHSSSDSKYINDVYSAYIAALHRGSIQPVSISVKPESYQLSLKFSTAPPHIS